MKHCIKTYLRLILKVFILLFLVSCALKSPPKYKPPQLTPPPPQSFDFKFDDKSLAELEKNLANFLRRSKDSDVFSSSCNKIDVKNPLPNLTPLPVQSIFINAKSIEISEYTCDGNFVNTQSIVEDFTSSLTVINLSMPDRLHKNIPLEYIIIENLNTCHLLKIKASPSQQIPSRTDIESVSAEIFKTKTNQTINEFYFPENKTNKKSIAQASKLDLLRLLAAPTVDLRGNIQLLAKISGFNKSNYLNVREEKNQMVIRYYGKCLDDSNANGGASTDPTICTKPNLLQEKAFDLYVETTHKVIHQQILRTPNHEECPMKDVAAEKAKSKSNITIPPNSPTVNSKDENY